MHCVNVFTDTTRLAIQNQPKEFFALRVSCDVIGIFYHSIKNKQQELGFSFRYVDANFRSANTFGCFYRDIRAGRSYLHGFAFIYKNKTPTASTFQRQ